MQAQRNGTPMLASSGYVAQVDETLCAACGECADVCQLAAISVNGGLARVKVAACMGCGVCVAHCPQEAISPLRDPAKGDPKAHCPRRSVNIGSLGADGVILEANGIRDLIQAS